MFGAYVKENRKALIALAVYTVVFALVFWLYRLPLGAAGYAALVCLFVLALWFAVDYRRFAARLRLLQRRREYEALDAAYTAQRKQFLDFVGVS